MLWLDESNILLIILVILLLLLIGFCLGVFTLFKVMMKRRDIKIGNHLFFHYIINARAKGKKPWGTSKRK